MFGIEDPWIWSAYLLCLLASALCVVYGLVSRAFRKAEQPAPEEKVWAAHEKEVEEEL
jgi:hypothetical protein